MNAPRLLVSLFAAALVARAADSARAVDWGYSAYLSGPIAGDLLRQAIEAAVRQRKTAAASGGMSPLAILSTWSAVTMRGPTILVMVSLTPWAKRCHPPTN